MNFNELENNLLDIESDDIVGVSSEEDNYFDRIVGHIEDIVMGDDFRNVQQGFLKKNYQVFEAGEENKLIYTDIFNQYTSELESFLDEKLTELLPTYSNAAFCEELTKRRGGLNGEIFELLFTLTDFSAFKEMILDYKAAQEGHTVNLTIDGKPGYSKA